MLYILHTRSRISSVEMVSGKHSLFRQCRFWFIARLTCSLPLGQGWQLNVVFPQVHPVDIVLLCPLLPARRFGGRGGGTDCFPEGYGKYKVKSSSWLGNLPQKPQTSYLCRVDRTVRDLEVLTAPVLGQSTL
jgi:hypothetical protein